MFSYIFEKHKQENMEKQTYVRETYHIRKDGWGGGAQVTKIKKIDPGYLISVPPPPCLHQYAHLDSTDVGHNATLNLAGTNLMIASGFHAEEPMVSVLLCRILHLRCHRLPSLFLAIELYLSPRVAILFGLAFDI